MRKSNKNGEIKINKQTSDTVTTEIYFTVPIHSNYAQLDKKRRYFFNFPASNLELMNDFLIDELVRKLSTTLSLLSTIDLKSMNIFSYQQGISYDDNIAFRKELIEKTESEEKRQELQKQIEDFQQMQQRNSEKSFVVYFDLPEGEIGVLSQVLDLLKKAAPTGELLSKQDIIFMLRAYLLRDMDKTSTNENFVPNRADFFMSGYTIHGYHRKMFVIQNYPESGEDGNFAQLAQIENVHINIQYEMSNDDISELVNKQGMKTQVLTSSFKQAEQEDGKMQKESTSQFYQEARKGNSSLIRTYIFIEVVGKTKEDLRKTIQSVDAELKVIGFTKSSLAVRQQQAFQSIYPLGENKLKTKYRSLTTTLAASFYPMSYESKNDRDGIVIGKISQGSTMSVSFAKRNKQTKNGNTFIDGASGSGKTVFIKNFLTQHADQGYRTYIFDSDNSEYKQTTERMGGVEMNASTGNIIINPFQPRYAGFDEDEKVTSIMSFHQSWLLEFLRTHKVYTEEAVDTLEIYIDCFYNELGYKNDTDALSKIPPIASDFYEFVQTFNHPLITEEERRVILKRIYSMCRGADSVLFNGQTSFTDCKNVSINTQALLMGDKRRAQAQLYNIMTFLFMQSVLDNKPTVLGLDEWYLFLDKENPMMAIQIRNWWKRCRKYNGIAIAGSQNLNDAMQEGLKDYTEAVISNCNNHVIFQPGAKEIDYVQDVFKLSEKEFKKVVQADRGEYLFFHGKNRYFVESESDDADNPFLLPSVLERII